MQNNSKQLRSMEDPGGILKEAFLEKEKALKTIQSNSLVPHEFSRVDITYISGGAADGEIDTATYYDIGIKQVSSFSPRPEQLGRPEMTMIDFSGQIGSMLLNTVAVCSDSGGRVGIVIREFGSTYNPSIAGTYRKIFIEIDSNDVPRVLANRFSSIFDADSEFMAVAYNNITMISSVTFGNKLNTKNLTSTLKISNVDGKLPKTINNCYLLLYRPGGEFHHLWFNVDGAGIDPNPIGSSGGIEIPVLGVGTQRDLIISLYKNINGSIYFSAYQDLNSPYIKIVCNEPGLTNEIVDVNCEFDFVKTDVVGEDQRIIRKVFLTYDLNGQLKSARSI